MIPEFPQFKKLELSDKKDVEKFTLKFPPYSDFNFVSLWSWNIKDEMRLSVLNNNLVIHFNDYLSGKLFYSFLGNNKVNETAEVLLKLSKKEGLEPVLKLVPEDSTKGLDLNKFKIEEDRDNFDYIYSIADLKTLPGGKFSKKRNQISNFLKNYPDAKARIVDLKDKHVRGIITNLFLEWLQRKVEEEEIFESHEETAVHRLLLTADVFKLTCVGIFIGEKLAAFLISELVDGDYVLAHASKINNSFVGVNAFLLNKNAEFLSSFGKKWFNYEQDLGMTNLRDAKIRFRPSTFLKKYKLTHL